ncbi:Flp family type IVb pilin [Agromyces sp. Marseille-Q5079]|uniref:Flp family type IVb pilin n=1 Tax=Agromyces sp. Marseille-Q5079 TaxID=3439059 RepID=UPI003D9C9C6E
MLHHPLRPEDGRRRLKVERGATAVEYGLVLAFIAAMIVGTITALGLTLGESFGDFVTAWGAA